MSKKKEISREKVIIKTSIIGIIVNVVLSLFKAVIGIISGAISITLDAVNNLSDALSSIITIVGTKLAMKAPDKEHPYGHGRVEYLSAMFIAIIISYAGITSLIESVKKIIHYEAPDYSYISLSIIAVAVIAKVILGQYVKNKGKKVNSDSLVNSGKDALMDSIISLSTLVSAGIFILFKISLEAYLGVIISIIIIKAGIEMFRETLSQMIGERVNSEFAKEIKETILSFEDVSGAYDLVLNNYGPDTYLGSVHIEVPDTFNAIDIDNLTRMIIKKVYEKHGIILTAVGIYALNTSDEKIVSIKEKITKILETYKEIIGMHGFYINKETNVINFDIIVDFARDKNSNTYENLTNELKKSFPDYTFNITLDVDISD